MATFKLTKKQLAEFTEEHLAYNRRMKRQGRHAERMTLQQYIDNRFGKVKITTSTRDYRPSDRYIRETPEIPSLDTGAHVTGKAERKVYTGTLVKGIATMHKSNAVPVIDSEQAKDIARMRRN